MAEYLIAGNWKMNGLRTELVEAEKTAAEEIADNCSVLICPPAVLLPQMTALLDGSKVRLGAQDCHPEDSGAFTGDISAPMLAESGASYVIVGHSERRLSYRESNNLVRRKMQAAWRAGLTAILCVGETETERNSGHAHAVVGQQFAECAPEDSTADKLVIAYEPVWAIGTGRSASGEEIADMHGFLREEASRHFGPGQEIPILYGGSVKGDNAAEIFSIADVNGALVGGASLRAADFIRIIRSVPVAQA